MAMSDLSWLVAQAQTAAEALMTDTCTVTAAGGEPVWDPDVNDYVTPAGAAVYSGKCRVRATDATVVSEAEVGGREIGVVRRSLRVPVAASTEGIARGHTVTITASGNPGLVGAVFTVAGPFDDSHGSARRIPLEGRA